MSDPTDPNLGPIATLIGSIVVAALGAAGLVVRRRQDSKDEKAKLESGKELTEKDEYDEVRQARAEATRYYNLYVFFRDAFHSVQSALRHLVRKVREHHPDEGFDSDIVAALALKSPENADPKS